MGADSTALRVAIVGAGPAGMYAADAIINHDDLPDARVDLFDRVPTPFGLVRYGVAPDHLSIRSVRDTLDGYLDEERIRFFGGVHIGPRHDGGALALEDLREHYDAVVLTYGASSDRSLGIPGEDLPGSISATEFVRWYTGHPDTDPHAFSELLANARTAVILGVGNVAVDVTRVLCKSRRELDHTDMPEHVLEALEASGIEQVHLIGRRGPAEASWTTKELKELGELDITSLEVLPGAFPLGSSSQSVVESNKVAARNVAVIENWLERTPRSTPRRLTVRFLARPVRILGESKVEAIEVERTQISDDGSVSGTGEVEAIPTDVVIRSVGYRGQQLQDVPFDERNGTIIHVDGRVMAGTEPMAGVYVAGWIKRGPSGIIGTNKKDAVATVESLVSDVLSGVLPGRRVDTDITESIQAEFVDTQGWRRIDAAERELGQGAGKDRVTIHDRAHAMSVGGQTP
jgi:ferredoxin--NADP+ reductase